MIARLTALRTGPAAAATSGAEAKAPPAALPPLPSFGTSLPGGPVPDPLPSLRETLSALIQAQPMVGEPIVRQILPQPGAMLGATLIFFLSALRGGDLRGWLGERATKALDQAGRGELAARLGSEFAALARQSAEPMGDFRVLLLPVYRDGEIHYLQMAVRRPPDDEASGDDGAGKRFLIEVEMSRTGPLQLDGLIKAKRFHLLIRTKGVFPPAMRGGIREVFVTACEACGLQPSLAFQTGPENWLRLGTGLGGAGPTHTRGSYAGTTRS